MEEYSEEVESLIDGIVVFAKLAEYPIMFEDFREKQRLFVFSKDKSYFFISYNHNRLVVKLDNQELKVFNSLELKQLEVIDILIDKIRED